MKRDRQCTICGDVFNTSSQRQVFVCSGKPCQNKAPTRREAKGTIPGRKESKRAGWFKRQAQVRKHQRAAWKALRAAALTNREGDG